MKKYTVTFKKEERNFLEEIASKGSNRSSKVINALILLGFDEGEWHDKRSTNKLSKVFNHFDYGGRPPCMLY